MYSQDGRRTKAEISRSSNKVLTPVVSKQPQAEGSLTGRNRSRSTRGRFTNAASQSQHVDNDLTKSQSPRMPTPSNMSGDNQAPSTEASLHVLLTEVKLLAIRLRQSVVLSGRSVGSAENEVLQFLQQQGPISVPNLARERHTTRQNIQVLANRLSSEGLIEFSPNPAHKRSRLLHLSAAARALCEHAKGKQSELLNRLCSGLSADEITRATALLRSIGLNLQNSVTSKRTKPAPVATPSARQRHQERPSVAAVPQEEEIPVSLL